MPRAKRRRPAPPRRGEPRAEIASPPDAPFAAAVFGDTRQLALCAQAQRALEVAIAECHDEALTDLILETVLPDPTTRRLRVWLRVPAHSDKKRHEHVLRRLHAARGFLRVRVAEEIHRKRTLELVFELLSGSVDPEGDQPGGDRCPTEEP